MPAQTKRQKQLAGDARAGWSARTSIRVRHRSVLRQQWRVLLVLGGALLACSVGASWFATGPLQRGFVLGSGLALALGAVGSLVVLLAGTAPLMMGEMAEQWTAQEARPLTRHGWRLVNHFGLGFGDQDHVLVGPGGVVLVETKWGATPWDLDDRDHFFQQALSQTARNARQLQQWHGVAAHGRPAVDAVLVLWGGARHKLSDVPPRRHRSGVVVMSGDQLQPWALRLGRDRLTDEQVESIWRDIDGQVERRDVHEQRNRPMPRSLGELVQRAVGCVLVALLGFLAGAQVLALSGSLTLWCLAVVSLTVLAEVVHRRTTWRWQARACQVGVVSTVLVGAFGVARVYLQA